MATVGESFGVVLTPCKPTPLALAKASALVGAAVAGVWIGFLLHVLPMAATVRAASSDRVGAIVGLVAGLALVGAALWLEHCCRTPKDNPEGS